MSAPRRVVVRAALVGLLAVVGFALAPTIAGAGPFLGSSVGSAPGGPAFSTLAACPSAGSLGTVTISAGGVSSDPTAVSVNGSVVTVLEGFSGNLSDSFANSMLDGSGCVVNATAYPTDLAALSLEANGITVQNFVTISSGSTDGILAAPSLVTSSATIESSTVTLAAGSTTALGIQLGNVFPATAVEPTGTFVVNAVTVVGPGAGGTAGETGIVVYGNSVAITNSTVSGFSLDTTTTSGANTYSSWFQDTQSVGILAGCAVGAPACDINSNTLNTNGIGIVYALMTSGFGSIAQSAVVVLHNTITNSLAYGMVLEPTGAAGVSLVESNTFASAPSGAPGAYLIGGTFSLTGNVFLGTNTTGTNGALQGQASCVASTIPTASVEATDCFNPATEVTLNANIFAQTNAPDWTATFPTYPATSFQRGGEHVTWSESGLTPGLDWSVTMNGTTANVPAPASIVGDLQNGSFSYGIGAIGGWYENTLITPGVGSVSGSAVVEPVLVFVHAAPGQLVLSSSGIPTNASLVSVAGTVATLRSSFAGNVTDYWADSTLNGASFTINTTGYPSDGNSIGVQANGVTVKDATTLGTGAVNGIIVAPALTSATIESSTVTLGAGGAGPGGPVGIEAGDIFPATSVEPTGTFSVIGNTVLGPGAADTAASEGGIIVWGSSVTVSGNTVRGFSFETGGSYFTQTQSSAIWAGCAPGALTCNIEANHVGSSSVGILYAMYTSSYAGIAGAPATIDGNTVTDSLAYGIVTEPQGTGITTVDANVVNNAASGAPGIFLIGTAQMAAHNVLIGTSTSGSNGASQSAASCAASVVPTASIEATDCFNGLTTITLQENVFAGTSVYWSKAYAVTNSSLLAGELATFTETGLPNGTNWSLSIGHAFGTPPGTVTATAPAPDAMVMDAQNISYNFTIPFVPGFAASLYGGQFSISGSPVNIPIVFTASLGHTLRFRELHLPAGALWSVDVLGIVRSDTTVTTGTGSTGSVSFSEAAGALVYNISGPAGWGVARIAGPGSPNQTYGTPTYSLSGVATWTVIFGHLQTVTFNQSSLAKFQKYAGSTWGVDLTPAFPHGGPAGQSKTSTGTSISFSLPTGAAFHFAIAGPGAEYKVLPAKGGFHVPKHALTKVVKFRLLTEAIVFREKGLQAGATWTVTIATGSTPALTFPTTLSKLAGKGVIRFLLPIGNYTYTVGVANTQAPTPASGTIAVLHAPSPRQLVNVTMNPPALPRLPSALSVGGPVGGAGLALPAAAALATTLLLAAAGASRSGAALGGQTAGDEDRPTDAACADRKEVP